MHKGVFVWNVKNKKINPKITQSTHAPGCPIKEGIREIFCLKTEKWLDNRGFRTPELGVFKRELQFDFACPVRFKGDSFFLCENGVTGVAEIN